MVAVIGDQAVLAEECTDLRVVHLVVKQLPGDRAAGEMHLLAVDPHDRGGGIGRSLVGAALARGRARGFRRMVLWTQPTMHAAQALYAASGFEREPSLDFEAAGRRFLVMSRDL